MAPFVRKEIELDPTIHNKPLRDQFEKLVLHPVHKLDKLPQSKALIVVLDALDECYNPCDNPDEIKLIIYLLSQLQGSASIGLKFLVTSRPELPIQLGFKSIDGKYETIVLQDIPQPIIERDITVFLRHNLTQIRQEYNDSVLAPDRQLPSDWPAGDVQKLVDMALPLFIYAATICRFLRDRYLGGPQDQLQLILERQRSFRSEINETYFPIVARLQSGSFGSEKEAINRKFKDLVGSIVLLADPLSKDSLARLLGIPLNVVEDQLDLLHSVLNVPSDRHSPVRLLHLSFREFLIDPKKSGQEERYPFWVDARQSHHKLATRCL